MPGKVLAKLMGRESWSQSCQRGPAAPRSATASASLPQSHWLGVAGGRRGVSAMMDCRARQQGPQVNHTPHSRRSERGILWATTISLLLSSPISWSDTHYHHLSLKTLPPGSWAFSPPVQLYKFLAVSTYMWKFLSTFWSLLFEILLFLDHTFYISVV